MLITYKQRKLALRIFQKNNGVPCLQIERRGKSGVGGRGGLSKAPTLQKIMKENIVKDFAEMFITLTPKQWGHLSKDTKEGIRSICCEYDINKPQVPQTKNIDPEKEQRVMNFLHRFEQ